MNILGVRKISFNALSNNPPRTKQEKDRDYLSVDNHIRKSALVNERIKQQISFLEQEILSLVSLCQNSDDVEKEDIRRKIEIKKQEIESLYEQIDDRRSLSAALWYGYHERL